MPSNIDDEIDKIRENFENGLVSCGLDAANLDYDKLAEVRTEYKKSTAHFIHQAEIKARQDQDRFSRGDEFLWFVRKLREFMGDSTSSRYKAFESNFISQYEHKYLEYFKVIDELTKQKDLSTKESK